MKYLLEVALMIEEVVDSRIIRFGIIYDSDTHEYSATVHYHNGVVYKIYPDGSATRLCNAKEKTQLYDF